MGSPCLVCLGWARCSWEGLAAMVPPLPGVIYHFRLLTWGPGASLLRWAAARGSSGAPWGRAASGEGRSGPAPPEAEAGARPAAGAGMGGAEAARADKGRGRSCGETVRDAASAEPAPAPSGPSSPSHGRRSGPLPATPGSASWALIPESSESWCSGLLVPFQTSVIAAGTWG